MSGLIAKSDKNSVAAVDSFDLGYSSDVMQALAEELGEGVDIPYERVKFPSAGAVTFELPGEDEDEPEPVKALEGVILFAHDINIYYATPYDGKHNPPDCASLDGSVGIERETGVCKDCSTCPYNRFGSGKNGGKACKNKKRVYLLPSGAVLPIILTLPPTSLKDYKTYISRQIVLRGLRSYEVVTRISLKADTSASGFRFSKSIFKRLGRVSDDVAPGLLKAHEDLKDAYMDYGITEEDITSGETVGSSDEDNTASSSGSDNSLSFEDTPLKEETADGPAD